MAEQWRRHGRGSVCALLAALTAPGRCDAGSVGVCVRVREEALVLRWQRHGWAAGPCRFASRSHKSRRSLTHTTCALLALRLAGCLQRSRCRQRAQRRQSLTLALLCFNSSPTPPHPTRPHPTPCRLPAENSSPTPPHPTYPPLAGCLPRSRCRRRAQRRPPGCRRCPLGRPFRRPACACSARSLRKWVFQCV